MKKKQTIITNYSRHLNTFSMEIPCASRTTGKFNIKLRDQNSPKIQKTKPKYPPKPSPVIFTSTCNSDRSLKTPIKLFVRINERNTSPDDFIEPLAELTIPNTEEYMRHRNSSEPIPAIVDINRARTRNSLKIKPPLPTSGILRKSLQRRCSDTLKKSSSYRLKKNLVGHSAQTKLRTRENSKVSNKKKIWS